MARVDVVISRVERDRAFLFSNGQMACSESIEAVSTGNVVQIAIENSTDKASYLDSLLLYDFNGDSKIDGYQFQQINLEPGVRRTGDTIYVSDESFLGLVEHNDEFVSRAMKVQLMDPLSVKALRREYANWQLDDRNCITVCNDSRIWMKVNGEDCGQNKKIENDCAAINSAAQWCGTENDNKCEFLPYSQLFTYGLAHFFGDSIVFIDGAWQF